MSFINTVIVMAAGAGTRFKSKRSKLLHDFAGKPVIKHLANSLARLKDTQVIFVVSYQKDDIIKTIGERANFVFVEQKVLDGTGGAVRDAINHIDKRTKRVAVIPGDTPLIPMDLISNILEDSADVCVVGTRLKTPCGFGRIKMDQDHRLVGIIEETDISETDKKIDLVNTSIYSFDREFLEEGITKLAMNKKKKEFYLTDMVGLAVGSKKKTRCVEFDNSELVLGANDRAGMLESAKKVWLQRALKKLDEGVTILSPETLYMDEYTSIGKDVEIYPNNFITGNSIIEEDVVILEGCRINNSKIGAGSVVGPYVIIDGAEIGTNNKVGPFTYVRPGTKTSDRVKIGGFVETKKAIVGHGSKIPHLSYVGDAMVGSNVNIGCGVITCNYDGFNKHLTEIGDNSFIGSDCQLVAPIKICNDAYVAAGTTVTKEVPAEALAISRTPQKNIEGYVRKIRSRKPKK